MRLGILQTGKVNEAIAPRFGEYPDMFARLYRAADPSIETQSYAVVDGELPSSPAECDAWLITGSRHGVYDDLPWIAPLKDFLRRTRAAGVPIIGICFGHQIMAEAFGGHVAKSEKGWGVGLHTYPIVRRESWMDEAQAVSVPASHRDQVVLQPHDTDVVASSLFTPYAGLAWRNRRAISFQFHPEFEPEYARALIEVRRERLPQPDAALASLDLPNDNARVGRWIRNFLAA